MPGGTVMMPEESRAAAAPWTLPGDALPAFSNGSGRSDEIGARAARSGARARRGPDADEPEGAAWTIAPRSDRRRTVVGPREA
ncbi:hypothetical protein GCM10011612_12350 [Actinomyces gaoshouyii]|uniref:Uncharacterized protein n=1 Tax=Actinomyces gaoshouyii TaxID=1960083 RepID=A0A8H9H8R2_9ACTO|nr:hypothetical protein GCM10011612_12350 [Actinomyces gaoshouyii]